MLNILLFENEDPPNQDPVQESDCKWDWLGALWPCPESWSPHTGQCAGWRVPHTGFTHVGRTGHRADQGQGTCRRAADGLVRVDVAQSALREARSPGTPRMHGHPGGLLVLVSLLWSSQPICVSGCDVKYTFPVRREGHACDSQGRFEWVFDFTRAELWAEASFSCHGHGKQEMHLQDCDSHDINELFCHSFELN